MTNKKVYRQPEVRLIHYAQEHLLANTGQQGWSQDGNNPTDIWKEEGGDDDMLDLD